MVDGYGRRVGLAFVAVGDAVAAAHRIPDVGASVGNRRTFTTRHRRIAADSRLILAERTLIARRMRTEPTAHRPAFAEMSDLDARQLGGLIGLFERAVGFYASLVNINAYHQPGVEAGKVAAFALLGRDGYDDERAKIEAAEPPRWTLR